MKHSESSLISLIDTRLVSENVASKSVKRLVEGLSNTTFAERLPIKVIKSEWYVSKEPPRLSREFKFNNFSHLKYFLDALLDYQEDSHHHASTLIDHRVVIVETYTRDLDMVTELDMDLATFCDEVYEDILHLNKISGEAYAFNE
jgi:pterin-4a-carbinolamine dehydratase